MRSILFCGLAVLLAVTQTPTTTLGKHVAWTIKDAGTTTVSTRLAGQALTVEIHTWSVPVVVSSSPSAQPYPECTYTQNPCSITDWIHIRVGGKESAVRQDGLAGLGDMHYVSVAGTPSRLVLTIAGGDGADAYRARLLFDHERLIERKVYGLDEEHPAEISHYYYTDIG